MDVGVFDILWISQQIQAGEAGHYITESAPIKNCIFSWKQIISVQRK